MWCWFREWLGWRCCAYGYTVFDDLSLWHCAIIRRYVIGPWFWSAKAIGAWWNDAHGIGRCKPAYGGGDSCAELEKLD